MDYYDDNPLKVNLLFISLKQQRKAEYKIRKALKAQRMAEELERTEKQKIIDLELQAIQDKENLKPKEVFVIRDQFDWGDFENDEGSEEDDEKENDSD